MRAILLTGGVGDIIAIESLMQDTERQSICCILYATRAAAPCIELFTDLPTFPNLKKHAILWKNFKTIFAFHSKEHLVDKLCAYQVEDLQKTVKKLMTKVEDWSIAKIFAEKRDYTYSSFVKYNIASIEKFNLPKNYYCICPYTNNDKRDVRRDYNVHDWRTTVDMLNTRQTIGVVVNNGDDYVPMDSCLINLNNKTTIREAVEIVKNGQGYIGIDSAFSVIATKVHNPTNIFVKSINNHCYRWAHIYYAPLTNFNFIKNAIN